VTVRKERWGQVRTAVVRQHGTQLWLEPASWWSSVTETDEQRHRVLTSLDFVVKSYSRNPSAAVHAAADHLHRNRLAALQPGHDYADAPWRLDMFSRLHKGDTHIPLAEMAGRKDDLRFAHLFGDGALYHSSKASPHTGYINAGYFVPDWHFVLDKNAIAVYESTSTEEAVSHIDRVRKFFDACVPDRTRVIDAKKCTFEDCKRHVAMRELQNFVGDLLALATVLCNELPELELKPKAIDLADKAVEYFRVNDGHNTDERLTDAVLLTTVLNGAGHEALRPFQDELDGRRCRIDDPEGIKRWVKSAEEPFFNRSRSFAWIQQQVANAGPDILQSRGASEQTRSNRIQSLILSPNSDASKVRRLVNAEKSSVSLSRNLRDLLSKNTEPLVLLKALAVFLATDGPVKANELKFSGTSDHISTVLQKLANHQKPNFDLALSDMGLPKSTREVVKQWVKRFNDGLSMDKVIGL